MFLQTAVKVINTAFGGFSHGSPRVIYLEFPEFLGPKTSPERQQVVRRCETWLRPLFAAAWIFLVQLRPLANAFLVPRVISRHLHLDLERLETRFRTLFLPARMEDNDNILAGGLGGRSGYGFHG